MQETDMTNFLGSLLLQGLGFHLAIWLLLCYGVGQGLAFIKSQLGG